MVCLAKKEVSLRIDSACVGNPSLVSFILGAIETFPMLHWPAKVSVVLDT